METNLVGFDDWYQIYPRHEAKEAARKAYAKACRLVSPEVLIEGAKRYALQRIGQDAKYTKLPATWLNAGCWNDELSFVPEKMLAPGMSALFHAQEGSPELDAWDAHWLATKGVHAPRDRRGKGGWWFETRWPPQHENAA